MRRTLNSLLQRRDGNVAMVFALSVLPFFVLAGMAIDVGRMVVVRERLGHSIDAAILAVGAAPELSESEAQALGEEFFAANFGDTLLGSGFNIDVVVNEDTVTMSAEAIVPTTLLGLVGHSSFHVYQEAQAVRGGNDLELVMVLDNTGSMSGSKIAALRDAASQAVEIVFASGGSDPDAVRVGLVPFAATVNVGADFERAWWLDANAASPLHSPRHNFSDDVNRWDLFDEVGVEWAGCVEARAIPHDIEDTTPTLGDPDTLFVPYFMPDAPGRRGDGRSGYSDSDSWLDDGDWEEVLEGSGGASCESGGGRREGRRGGRGGRRGGGGGGGECGGGESGSGHTYETENEARQAYIGKYSDNPNPRGDGPNSQCVDQPVAPLTNNENALLDAIDDMGASGYTNIPNGAAWGIRLLSPEPPFSEGRDWDTAENLKAMIILTDGQNVLDGQNNHNSSRYSSYGFSAEERLRSETSSDSALSGALDDRLEATCAHARDLGIRVYTITFQVSGSSVRTLMEECASRDERGDPLYWDSPSNNELHATFREIARDLVDLRLSK